MRRVMAMVGGLIGIVMLSVSVYVLWLSWDGDDRHASHAVLSTSDEEHIRQSNLLVSVPGSNSADTVLILPDTRQMGGAKASLDALSGPHLLGMDSAVAVSTAAWSGCLATSAGNCPAWVLRTEPGSDDSASAMQAYITGAYHFMDDQPMLAAAWFLGWVIEIGSGLWLLVYAERHRVILSGGR